VDPVAIVLAAGAGTRLGALGRLYSKPMLPIAGRPLIHWVIAHLQDAGAESVIVVGHPSDGALAKFLRDDYPDARLVLQAERRGIADALRMALPVVADATGYLACACDSLFVAADVRALIARGRVQGGAAVVGVLDMGAAATVSRSAVHLEGDRVVEIVEKPPPGSVVSSLVAAPLYWLPAEFAPHLAAAPAVGAERYISTALNSFVHAGGLVYAVALRTRVEVTTPEDVAPAEAYLRVGYGSGA